MAKFKYVGIDDVSSPAEVYHYGTRFEMGQVSEVPDQYADKLERQEGFEKVGDEEETIGDRSVEDGKKRAKLAREHAAELKRREQEIEDFKREVEKRPLPEMPGADQEAQNKYAEGQAEHKGEGELQQQHKRDQDEEVRQEQQHDAQRF